MSLSETALQHPLPTTQSWFARNHRWWVLATLFGATFLNYFDRQTLSVAIEPISREFGLTPTDRGTLLAAFVYAYAIAHLFIGFLIDRIQNIKRFFALMVVGWSLSTVLVGLTTSYTQILWLRYALGLFEAANFPLCLLLIARIFPPKQRSLAAGIFNSGAVLATLVAPKLVIYFSTEFNWRYSFYVTGGLGVVWLLPWLLIFRNPPVTKPLHEQPTPKPGCETSTKAEPLSAVDALKRLLRLPAFWIVTLIGIGLLPGWYFLSQWLPTYLTRTWNVGYNQTLGDRLTLVYLVQDVGLWVGGGLVWWLSSRGLTVLSARRSVIIGAYAMMMSILLLPQVDSIEATLAVLCVYAFGLAAWQANQQAFKQDVWPARIATVAALVGFAETLSSAFLIQKVGAVVQQTGGFNAIFWLLAGCFTLSLVALLCLRKKWLQTG